MTFCTIFYIIKLAAHERRKKFPDSSMVEHSTVNRVVVSSSLTRGAKWPDGQAVKTPPFHGGIGGSIPPPVTNLWALSSAGRASALQAECQQFDPVSAHHKRRRYMRNAVSSFLFCFFGQEVDTLWNRESCRASGQTLYPLTRVLSPFQGDTAP